MPEHFFIADVQSGRTQLLLGYNICSITIKSTTDMEEFALIMRHQDGAKVASSEQIQQWMRHTMDWIGSIAAQNKFVSGTGLLFDNARVLHKRGLNFNLL